MAKRKAVPAGKVRCALYARVSSEAQDVDLSISAQLKALRKYAAKHGWTIVREYVDEAKSARTDKRPAFKGMVENALAGRFTKILVWKFSRFARNRRDSIVYKSLLRKNGCDVISANEKVEDTPEGHLLEGMIEVIDQFFSDNMGSDIRRGMREAIERGFSAGRRIPDGYRLKKVQDGEKTRNKYVPDKRRAPVIKKIFRQYAGAVPVTRIVTDLNANRVKKPMKGAWDKNLIYRILRNPIYAGAYVLQGEVVNERFCEPLVPRTLFNQVQARLDSRAPEGASPPRAAESDYLLTGLLKCSICGYALKGEIAHGRGGTYRYYLCSGRSRRGICDAPRIPKEVVEKAVLDRITKHIITRKNVENLVELLNESTRESIAATREDLTMVRREKAVVTRALENLYVRSEQSDEARTAFAPRILERQEELDVLVRKEVTFVEVLEKRQKQELPDKKTVRRAVTQMRRDLGSDDFLKQKGFVQSLVQRMYLHPKSGRARIIYTFPIPKLHKSWESIHLAKSRHNKSGSSEESLVGLGQPMANRLVDYFVIRLPVMRLQSRSGARQRQVASG